MSSYINFYVRGQKEFCPIGSFSRNSYIYEFGRSEGAPYSRVSPLTYDMLENISVNFDERFESYKESIENYKNKISFISKCTMETEEKLELYDSYSEGIEECNQEIKELEQARNFYKFLEVILDDIAYSDIYSGDKYLYFGIDTGYIIKEEDIIEE